MNCPRCEGRPSQQSIRFVNRGDAGCTAEVGTWQCEMCSGAGQITEEHARRYRIARDFRKARVDDHLSLMDLSNRWQFSPAEISAGERLGIGHEVLFEEMHDWLMDRATAAAPEQPAVGHGDAGEG